MADPNPETPIPQQDPLLGSDAFIDSTRNETPDVQFKPGEVINAIPITIVAPEDGSDDETTPKPRNKGAEERPSWLPEDWTFYTKVRASGASAGTTDRYYMDPTGKRRFRSKNEVFKFLETGVKPNKRKSAPEADSKPTGDSVTPKQKKSKAKSNKSEASKSKASKSKASKSEASKSEGLAAEVKEDLAADVKEGVEAEVKESVEAEMKEGVDAEVKEGVEADVKEGVEADVKEGVNAEVNEGEGVEAEMNEDLGPKVIVALPDSSGLAPEVK